MADLIVATITNTLVPPTVGRERLFFVMPTPTPYAKAETEMLAIAGAEGGLRVLELPHGGRCYAVSCAERFRALLPLAFRLGPPELSLIAANCGFGLGAEAHEIANFVLEALGSAPSTACDFVGMHFDSGDLVELF